MSASLPSPAVDAAAPGVRAAPLPDTWRPVLLCLVGALAVAALWIDRPDGRGAARLTDPAIALALLDTVWLLLLAWPAGGRWADSVVLVAVGVPFHAALAGAAAAGGGHLAAWALVLGPWAAVAVVAGHRRRYAVCLGGASLVLPLAGYAMREFLGLETLDAVLASPLTGPTLLAHGAAATVVGDALPALLAAALVLVVCVPGRDPPESST